MSDEISDDQLIHYFAGECSEEEAAEIKAWINADPVRQRRVRRLFRIWKAAEQDSDQSHDVDAMWQDLERRLGFSSPQQEEPKPDQGARSHPERSRREPQSRFPVSKPSYRVAALGMISALVLATILWVLTQDHVIGVSSNVRTITTKAGQRATVQLEDGTRVTLNAESRLKLPPEFGDDSREVNLEGQAFFEVESEDDRPFRVHAGGAVTEVMGTRFNVGAYPDDSAVNVVVTEGIVAVRSESDREENNVMLMEQQLASVSRANSSVVRKEVDPSQYVAWTNGRLVFKNAEFPEVARRLHRWYGLKVELIGKSESVDHLNSTFKDEPVSEVLRIIAETLDLQYKRKKKTVTFFVQS